MENNSVTKIFLVAGLLCLVCSVIVSFAAVSLKPRQEQNKRLELQRNVLEIAGVIHSGSAVSRKEIIEQFARIESQIVNLKDGAFTTLPGVADDKIYITATDYAAATGATQTDSTFTHDFIAARIYLLRQQEKIYRIILPIQGQGLWSTLYGFMAVEGDGETVAGITFYEHAETPGLGGEIDNPKWQNQFKNKKIYDQQGAVALRLVKRGTQATASNVTPNVSGYDHANVDGKYLVDALSGASLTTNGVNKLLSSWLGEEGFAPFLRRIQRGES